MQQFKKALQIGFVSVVASVAVGCSTTAPETTHHWVSQDNVAGSVYRSDVAACSQSGATAGTEQQTNTAEFRAYQKCMNERGYALVAANEIGTQKQK